MTKFYVAAHGVIQKEDKVLITRRSLKNDFMAGYWDFPGGMVEAGETPEVALRREIIEETKLEVSSKSIDYVFTSLGSLPEAQYFILVYEVDYKSGEVELDPEEHDDYKWVEKGELKDYKLIHFVESWLEHAS